MRIKNYEDVKVGSFIFVERKDNDSYEEYFTTEEDALKSARYTADHLTSTEKENTILECGVITRIDDDGYDYNAINQYGKLEDLFNKVRLIDETFEDFLDTLKTSKDYNSFETDTIVHYISKDSTDEDCDNVKNLLMECNNVYRKIMGY